jgi:hypothetical protein
VLRALEDPTRPRSPAQGELARALREIGTTDPSPTDLGSLAERIQKHIERRVGDYTIKPDYAAIFTGLKDALGL